MNQPLCNPILSFQVNSMEKIVSKLVKSIQRFHQLRHVCICFIYDCLTRWIISSEVSVSSENSIKVFVINCFPVLQLSVFCSIFVSSEVNINRPKFNPTICFSRIFLLQSKNLFARSFFGLVEAVKERTFVKNRAGPKMEENDGRGWINLYFVYLFLLTQFLCACFFFNVGEPPVSPFSRKLQLCRPPFGPSPLLFSPLHSEKKHRQRGNSRFISKVFACVYVQQQQPKGLNCCRSPRSRKSTAKEKWNPQKWFTVSWFFCHDRVYFFPFIFVLIDFHFWNK